MQDRSKMAEIILEGVDFNDLGALEKEENAKGGEKKSSLKDFFEALLSQESSNTWKFEWFRFLAPLENENYARW